MSYCGVYCGACAWCNGRWRKAARELTSLLEAYPPLPFEGKLSFDYESLRRGLQWLRSERYSCSGCRSGGGHPSCEVRACVRGKHIEFCHQCADFPCEKLSKIQREHTDNIDNIKRVKEVGLKKWSEEQEKKVRKGYDIHL